MDAQLEKLIDLALVDGVLTEKEKEVLYRKAQALGVDKDELDMILDARLHKLKGAEPKRETVTKCPNCGDVIHGLSQICSSCGYVLNTSTVSSSGSGNLHDALHRIESLIVEVKSVPKPSFVERLKVVFLTYITVGLYLIYRRLNKDKAESFDSLIAKCNREQRQINTYYGSDPKVKSLLAELNAEIQSIQTERKSLALKTNLGCFGLVFLWIGFYAVWGGSSLADAQSKMDRDRAKQAEVDSLIGIGEVKNALRVAKGISTKWEKEIALDKVTVYNVTALIDSGKMEEAKKLAYSINDKYTQQDLMDKIIIMQVDRLVELGDLKQALKNAALIKDDTNRDEVMARIKSAMSVSE